jgi:hypothetical protein
MKWIGGYKRMPISKPGKAVKLALKYTDEDPGDYHYVFCAWNMEDIPLTNCKECDYCRGIGKTQVWCGWWGYQT